MEIDRRDGGDGIDAEAFGVPCQLAAVGGVVTGDVRDDDELAANSVHNGFEDGLAFLHAMIDTFAGRAADVETGNALVQKVFCKALHARCADAAVFVIARIKRRENALIFFQLCVHVLFSFL